MADLLDVVALLSAVGAGLGCASVGTRMLFALGRDGILRRELADVSAATGTPLVALAVEMSISLGLIVGFAIAGTAAITTFFYIATMGILSLLVMYIVTNVGALRYLFLGDARRAPVWEIVLPVGGIGFAIYTLYKNVWPVPDYPFNLFPYIVAAWLAGRTWRRDPHPRLRDARTHGAGSPHGLRGRRAGRAWGQPCRACNDRATSYSVGDDGSPEDFTCAQLVEIVTEYLEGGLTFSERVIIESHLLDCEGCVNYIDQMRTTITAGGASARGRAAGRGRGGPHPGVPRRSEFTRVNTPAG